MVATAGGCRNKKTVEEIFKTSAQVMMQGRVSMMQNSDIGTHHHARGMQNSDIGTHNHARRMQNSDIGTTGQNFYTGTRSRQWGTKF